MKIFKFQIASSLLLNDETFSQTYHESRRTHDVLGRKEMNPTTYEMSVKIFSELKKTSYKVCT